jgi:hypothetical protein
MLLIEAQNDGVFAYIMSSQRLNPDETRRAQDLVSRLGGVSSCHISTGPGGDVTEVHVVSTSHKPPKLVARDVESLLKAELGVDIDYRKIGVVNLEPDVPGVGPEAVPGDRSHGAERPETPAGVVVEEFPVQEYASRFAFHSVNLFVSTDSVKAEVELTRDAAESFGTYQSEHTAARPWGVVAEATLRAISEFLDDATRLCLGEVLKVAVGDKSAFVVRVDVVDGRSSKSLAGCSIVSENENQSVVFATLDAVNRVVGRLDYKSVVEYKIR